MSSVHEFTMPLKDDSPISSPAETRHALAANLRERARAVDMAGEPVLQIFDHPSFRDLQEEERQLQLLIANFAGSLLFGSVNRQTAQQLMALEGAAMFLVRRVHPEWVQAAQEQAIITLLESEDALGAGLFRGLSYDESKQRATWLVGVMWASFIGTLENATSVKPATYLRLAAAATEQGAR